MKRWELKWTVNFSLASHFINKKNRRRKVKQTISKFWLFCRELKNTLHLKDLVKDFVICHMLHIISPNLFSMTLFFLLNLAISYSKNLKIKARKTCCRICAPLTNVWMFFFSFRIVFTAILPSLKTPFSRMSTSFSLLFWPMKIKCVLVDRWRPVYQCVKWAKRKIK